MLTLLDKGGLFMIPLGLLSLVGLGLIVDRIYHLYFKFRIDDQTLVKEVARAVDAQNYRRAIGECEARDGHPLAEVLRAGLLKADKSDREVQRSMEEAMIRHTPKVTKRTNYLAMLANVATLLGLLGTIQGLIHCFASVASASAAEKQVALANGISVAMFTTFSGLIIAIPCLVAYTVLHNKEMSLMEAIEEAGITIFNRISGKNRTLLSDAQAKQKPERRSNAGRVRAAYQS